MPVLTRLAPIPSDTDWDLAAESIAVKIRWFGLVVGGLLANLGPPAASQLALNLILILGLSFTTLDTLFFLRRRVFLRDYPLIISLMESLFIGLLGHFHTGPDSPFRFYYLLSLICCAIRYTPLITFATCGLDCLSYLLLYLADTDPHDPQRLALMFVLLVWVAWAASGLSRLLKRVSDRLRMLNAELQVNQEQLETRISDRTRELEESQAQVLHQEKMAAFGLLAAGIAHEVGNPLTSISALIQMLERRDLDEYTRERLGQVSGQLVRIQAILRELINFSRPASQQRGIVSVQEVVAEALGIAKYYKGGKNRTIGVDVPDGLPMLEGVRDQLVQVIFNLVLNAIDATGKGGEILVAARRSETNVILTVKDNGSGISPGVAERLFRPYFTTKTHGTGLGLFVLKKIVEAHSGRVSFESEAGKGTLFRVVLPAAKSE